MTAGARKVRMKRVGLFRMSRAAYYRSSSRFGFTHPCSATLRDVPVLRPQGISLVRAFCVVDSRSHFARLPSLTSRSTVAPLLHPVESRSRALHGATPVSFARALGGP